MIIFLIPIIGFIWLFIQYFSVFGKLTLTYDFSSESPVISEWTPAGRALAREKNLQTGETYQRIVGEPTYMEVSVPRSYDTVDVTVEYANDEQPFVELGLVTNTEPWNVRLHPFDSAVLNEALLTWEATTDERGVTLLQRHKQFETVAEFEQALPQDQGVAYYQYAPQVTYSTDTPIPDGEPLLVNRYLRGRHDFVTYVPGDTLHVEFDMVDINRGFDEDVMRVEVKDPHGAVIYDDQLPDDGVVEASGVLSKSQTLIVDLPVQEAGAYTVSVPVTDDIVIQQIRSTHAQFVAKDRLFLINNEEYRDIFPDLALDETALFFNGAQLIAIVDHETALQNMSIGNDVLYIDTVHSPHIWEDELADGAQRQKKIVSPLNDVHLQTTGYFAFTKDSFFDPDYFVQSINETTQLAYLDYILYTNYTPPVENRRSYTQTVQMNFADVAGDRKDLLFALSAPGIDRNNHELKVFSVQFDFHRAPLHTRILQRLKLL